METKRTVGTPLVSVVLPTYDRPEMLVEAVESVARQEYSEIELIVVDDASSTPAEAVLEDRAPSELRWRCLRHEENRGANAARNTGIQAASGDILAFLDDDDRWLPEKLEAQVAALEADGEEVGVALIGQQFVIGDRKTGERLPEIEGDATPGLVRADTGGPFSAIAVRRSVVEEAGLPDERFPAWQDREWLVRLSRHCEFAAVERPLVVRRFGDYNQINDMFEPKRDTSYPLFVEKHQDLAAEYDLEGTFVASLAANIAAAGLSNGYYADARRFAAKSIRTDPRVVCAYLYLFLALGGPHSYGLAVRLNRVFETVKRGVRTVTSDADSDPDSDFDSGADSNPRNSSV